MLKVVGMADMKISTAREDVLVTYALGSCVGLTVYDPYTGVGGMLHAMMPDSKIDMDKSRENPFMFIDTGLPLLFEECIRLGAKKEWLQVKAAGCASLATGKFFKMGYRNFTSLNNLLAGYGLPLLAYDVGGKGSRTMRLSLFNGEVQIEDNGKKIKL
ncbi:MAG: Chemoreceptor glutamine deamidase CheD [bacterium ADurb.Bin243]|nr:MAG: Chemoreceptor glutamine deamidase CheD [bacterium ADurb.Bin243]HOD42386.1 chemotaxis protein CheD [Candidatus Wallbacteria bacterium]